MPKPTLPSLDKPRAVMVTGVGGTGIVTIGAIMAMAAHLEDKGASTMDQTGLAQKGGAVTSHVRIAAKPEDIHTVRIDIAGADVILGCDTLVTAEGETLSKIYQGQTKVVLNTHKSQTGEFTHNTEWNIENDAITTAVADVCGKDNLHAFDATHIATRLMGNSIATNMFVLGYAYQQGYIPLMQDAVFRAIELNGVAIDMNQKAFIWGRRAAFDLDKVIEITTPPEDDDSPLGHRHVSETLEEMIARRVTSLTQYQNRSYATQFETLINKVKAADITVNGEVGDLTKNAVKYLYKVMAYKDEYEVARLYTDGLFMKQMRDMFEGDIKIKFNLAPPLLARRDEKGRLQKMEFGAWILPLFKVMAGMRALRGTPLDIFGYTAERKHERQLIKDYSLCLEKLILGLNKDNYDLAAAIAAIPEDIRGYGHVKEDHVKRANLKWDALMKKFLDNAPARKEAA